MRSYPSLSDLKNVQKNIHTNQYYNIYKNEHPEAKNDYSSNAMFNYLIKIFNDVPVYTMKQMCHWVRQTDEAKTKDCINNNFYMPEEYVKNIAKRLLNGEIDYIELQDSLNPTKCYKNKLDENKNHENKKEYDDLEIAISEKTMLTLFINEIDPQSDLSQFSYEKIKTFMKKYGYTWEHTFNTHFNDPVDLSSVIPLESKYHTGPNSKHDIFGNIELSALIYEKENNIIKKSRKKKDQEKYNYYLETFEPIYNMKNGKDKILTVLKLYDTLFDPELSTRFFTNVNEYFGTNIDINIVKNFHR